MIVAADEIEAEVKIEGIEIEIEIEGIEGQDQDLEDEKKIGGKDREIETEIASAVVADLDRETGGIKTEEVAVESEAVDMSLTQIVRDVAVKTERNERRRMR